MSCDPRTLWRFLPRTVVAASALAILLAFATTRSVAAETEPEAETPPPAAGELSTSPIEDSSSDVPLPDVEPATDPVSQTADKPTATEEKGTGPGLADHAVKLLVTHRTPDFFRPWTRSAPSKSSGSGAVLPGGRILTNAHVVTYASEVMVQLRKGGDQLRAKVIAFAPDIDLALVELEDPTPLVNFPGLEFGDDLPVVKDQVSVYGYPTGGDDLSITDGIVSRIEYTGYYNDGWGTRVQVDAALNPGNSGGPALRDGKLIGLVFSKIEAADNIGYLIPIEEVKAFLADAEDGKITGRPQLWTGYQTAENPALRAYVKLPAETTGVIVRKSEFWPDDFPLKGWDVVTHVGDHPIDNQGYVDVRDDLRLRFNYYVPKLARDGHVPLTVWRDGASVKVEAPVEAIRDLVVPSLRGKYPEYFIYGPVTFTGVTRDFITASGSNGMSYFFRINSPVMSSLMTPASDDRRELVIVASRLFPHPSIKGYSNYPFGVIGSLNGQKIRSLRHLAELLAKCQDEFVRLEPADESEPLVFRREELTASTEMILEDEGIRYQASESLRDVFDE